MTMAVAGLLLTPGAGGTRDSPALLAVERAAAPLPVRRIDLAPARVGAGPVTRRPPPTPAAAITRVDAEADAFARELGVPPARLALGGRSFGGRMCSMAAARGRPAAALVLLSYPLHPPGRPDRLRVEHFPDLRLPVLFVSGTADPFGSPAEFDTQLAAVPGPVTVIRLPGGHDLRGSERRVGEIVADWLAGRG